MISKNADILKRHRILLLHLILLLNIYMYKKQKQKMFPLGYRIRSTPYDIYINNIRVFSFLLYFLPIYLFYYSFI